MAPRDKEASPAQVPEPWPLPSFTAQPASPQDGVSDKPKRPTSRAIAGGPAICFGSLPSGAAQPAFSADGAANVQQVPSSSGAAQAPPRD